MESPMKTAHLVSASEVPYSVNESGKVQSVKLKNGSEEEQPFVTFVMTSINGLVEQGLPGLLALYDLVEVCKDNDYRPQASYLRKLQDLGLLNEDGTVHNSIRNIVLSAVHGEGRDRSIGSPLADLEAPTRADGSRWGDSLGERSGRAKE